MQRMKLILISLAQVTHTAMADIRESLAELKFYRRTIFKQPGVSYREYLMAGGRESQSSPQSSPRTEAKRNLTPGKAGKSSKKGHK